MRFCVLLWLLFIPQICFSKLLIDDPVIVCGVLGDKELSANIGTWKDTNKCGSSLEYINDGGIRRVLGYYVDGVDTEVGSIVLELSVFGSGYDNIDMLLVVDVLLKEVVGVTTPPELVSAIIGGYGYIGVMGSKITFVKMDRIDWGSKGWYKLRLMLR